MRLDKASGKGDAMRQVAAGLKFFGEKVTTEGDLTSASKFNNALEANMAAIDVEITASWARRIRRRAR